MRPRYSVSMPPRQTLLHSHASLPPRWVMTDARNDDVLEHALRTLPYGGGGLIFRHYHLPPGERAARFRALRRLCHSRGLPAVWAGSAAEARARGADGCYGPAERIGPGPALLRLASAHGLREIGRAGRARADAILLSPVFPTRSHPGTATLGPVRFLLLGRHSLVPLLALGGMNAQAAQRLPGTPWAAIDGIGRRGRRSTPFTA